MICGGSRHTVVLDSQGELYACGNNNESQAGTWSHTPSRLSLNEKMVSVSCGKLHTISVGESGSVYGWGYNCNYQLGFSEEKNVDKPRKVPNLNHILSVSCGSYFSICVDNEGFAWAFGASDRGQLGTGSYSSSQLPEQVPDWAFEEQKIISVACGDEHSLFLTNEGHVYSAGANDYGQLGIGTYDNSKYSSKLFPTEISINSDIIKILCGDNFSVLVDSYGGVWMMGKCTDGLGDNCSATVVDPTIVPDLRVTSIDCGSDFVVCINEKSQLLTWGANVTFSGASNGLPRVIKRGILNVGCGRNTVFIYNGKHVKCTGINADGQLGVGDCDFVYEFERKNSYMNESMFEKPIEIEIPLPLSAKKSARK